MQLYLVAFVPDFLSQVPRVSLYEKEFNIIDKTEQNINGGTEN